MSIRVCASALVLVSALAGLGWPRLAFGQDKSAEGGAFRSQVDLVSVYFTVRDDKKRLVGDLAQGSFSVSENGQPQAIKFFAHHSEQSVRYTKEDIRVCQCGWTSYFLFNLSLRGHTPAVKLSCGPGMSQKVLWGTATSSPVTAFTRT